MAEKAGILGNQRVGAISSGAKVATTPSRSRGLQVQRAHRPRQGSVPEETSGVSPLQKTASAS